ncbi:MAG TPA: aminotransferase class V-fold PLP-dependent enzyme, partial [Rhizomicrobium sp.]|nr:aminotransferase class V-fold PLP-dependent enzyme [Rhizomicrobium sp.]
MLYLDHNATAPLRDEARAAMLRALDIGGNPSSVHAAGRATRAMVEEAREQVAAFAGASPGQVIFTSGGAEANALALRGAIMGAAEAEDRITRLFVAATAHDSVRAVAASLADTFAGVKLTEIPVTESGRIDPAVFRSLLMNGKGRVLVSLIFANNETGVIEDIAALAAVLRNEGGEDSLLHVDAVSSGYSPIRFLAWGADYLSLSAHKIGGPQGVGALVATEDAPLAPLFNGAQEKRRRAGTENVSGIAGFGAAARALQANFDAESASVAAIRDGFERELHGIAPNAVIFGEDALRQKNVSCFA